MPSQNSADTPWDGNNPYAINNRAQQYFDIGDALRNMPQFWLQNIQAGVAQQKENEDRQDKIDASPWLQNFVQSNNLLQKSNNSSNPTVDSISNLLSNGSASFTDQTGTASFGPGSLNIRSSDPSQTNIGLNILNKSLSLSRNFGNTNVELSGGLGSTPSPYPAGTDPRVYKWGFDPGPWAKLGFTYPIRSPYMAPQTEDPRVLPTDVRDRTPWQQALWIQRQKRPPQQSYADQSLSAGQQLWESGGYNR
jgi:hypothetical protein